MRLSQLQEPLWHRRSPDRNISKSWHHLFQIEATVESVAEFGQVPRKMFLTQCMKNTMKSCLNISYNSVDPLKLWNFNALGATAGNNGKMVKSSFAKSSKTSQSVRDDIATWGEMFFSPGFNSIFGKSLYLAESDLQRITFLITRYCCDEGDFSRCPTATNTIMLLAAPIGVINLDELCKWFTVVSLLHNLLDLMFHQEGRIVRDANGSFEAQCGNTDFRLSDEINTKKPNRQRQLGVRKKGSRCKRYLAMTAIALKQSSAFKFAIATMTTLGANITLWPSPKKQSGATLLLGAEMR